MDQQQNQSSEALTFNLPIGQGRERSFIPVQSDAKKLIGYAQLNINGKTKVWLPGEGALAPVFLSIKSGMDFYVTLINYDAPDEEPFSALTLSEVPLSDTSIKYNLGTLS